MRREREGRRRRSEPTALGELVPAVLGPREGALAVSIVTAVWERVLPPRVVKNASPTRLREGVLHVETTTSAWAQELTLMAPDVLGKLRAAMPSLELRELRPRSGSYPKRARKEERRPPKVPPLSESELPEALREEVARVGDAALRDTILRAARQSLAHAGKRR